MAAKEYSQWNALGRPATPARPIADLIAKMKKAFPAGRMFGYGANEAHLTAYPPEDHTPFSYTGWPLESPHWFVFATDLMTVDVAPVGGQKLFDYYLAEAKAGRMPWMKYIIWQAKLYDVRNNWRPQANAGHYDHIHISARTDYQNYSLGNWSAVPLPPQPEVDMTPEEHTTLLAMAWRTKAILDNSPTVLDGPTKGEVNQLHVALKANAPLPVTTEQLEQIKAAAGAGGVLALDGVTVQSTIKKD